MTLYKWSQTAENNAAADSSINWQEGQSPSSVNDSGRAMMASIAKHRDDIAGAIVTGGSSTAYTVTSYQVFGTLAHMSGQMMAFTPHTTNGATVTLNVDGLGAKPLRSAPSTELLAGMLIQGTPYTALYSNSDAAWYLQNFYGNPYNIPLGGGLPFFGPTAPNSSFAFPFGQAISRTTYSSLFSIFGTIYGSGDGATTFNVPDLRGRVLAGKDDMGGSAASRLTSAYFGTATNLGAVGGAENTALTPSQIPSITATGTATISPTSNYVTSNQDTDTYSTGTGGSTVWRAWPLSTSVSRATPSLSVSTTSSNTGGNPHRTVQPTIICNYIVRII